MKHDTPQHQAACCCPWWRCPFDSVRKVHGALKTKLPLQTQHASISPHGVELLLTVVTFRRQHENLWQLPYWQSMSSNALSVLQHLCHCRSYIYEGEEHRPAETLWKAAARLAVQDYVSPVDICRAHQVFADAALLERHAPTKGT
ncbi:hypothetical protein ABBQ32_005765 [Trebouxia sp. C0010 RCD-2024]